MIAALVIGTVLAIAGLCYVLYPLFYGVPAPVAPRTADRGASATATARAEAVAVLREIEFDRETGKLSDEDYATLKTAYTRDALAELRAAGADMDTSVAELRTPLEGRSVERLLGERASELVPASEAQISVRGSVGELPAHVAAHVYRIAAEALTNAVRHSGAEHVDVVLARNGSSATIEVRDDGKGLPAIRRPGSNGLRSMRARADAIGAELSLDPGTGGRGTRVVLTFAPQPDEGTAEP